jgi:hypothetical protein
MGQTRRQTDGHTESAPLKCELSWLLPLMAGGVKLKIQIFVVDKDTEDMIGKHY